MKRKEKITRKEFDEHNALCDQWKKEVALRSGPLGDFEFVKMFDNLKLKESNVIILEDKCSHKEDYTPKEAEHEHN